MYKCIHTYFFIYTNNWLNYFCKTTTGQCFTRCIFFVHIILFFKTIEYYCILLGLLLVIIQVSIRVSWVQKQYIMLSVEVSADKFYFVLLKTFGAFFYLRRDIFVYIKDSMEEGDLFEYHIPGDIFKMDWQLFAHFSCAMNFKKSPDTFFFFVGNFIVSYYYGVKFAPYAKSTVFEI